MDSELRKKDLITYYRYKRTFLMTDEWGLYLLLLFLHYFNFSTILILSILVYGGTGIYTSYKNLEKLEKQLVPIDQDTFLYQDVVTTTSWIAESVYHYLSRQPIFVRNNPHLQTDSSKQKNATQPVSMSTGPALSPALGPVTSPALSPALGPVTSAEPVSVSPAPSPAPDTIEPEYVKIQKVESQVL